MNESPFDKKLFLYECLQQNLLFQPEIQQPNPSVAAVGLGTTV